MLQPVKKLWREIWDATFATAMPLVGTNVFIGVFTAIANKGCRTLMADLTLAPGTLATALAVTLWQDPYELANGWLVTDGNLKTFKGASSADDCDVTGWYLATAATSGLLLGFALLPSPVTLTYTVTELKVVPRLVLSDNGTWDASIAFNSEIPA